MQSATHSASGSLGTFALRMTHAEPCYTRRRLFLFSVVSIVACSAGSNSDAKRARVATATTGAVASVSDTAYGYLIVPELKFSGDMPTDTLIELRPKEVPQSLRQLALRVAVPRDTSVLPADTRCARFFRATQRAYIIILAIKCPVSPTARITHNNVYFLVKVDQTGDARALPISNEALAPASLWPDGRTIHGAPVIIR